MTTLGVLIFAQVAAAAAPAPAIRINQLGYLPDAPKVAVLCSVTPLEVHDFTVEDAGGRRVLQRSATAAKPFGPCVANYRLDFSTLKTPGEYRIAAAGVTSPAVRIRADAYAGSRPWRPTRRR